MPCGITLCYLAYPYARILSLKVFCVISFLSFLNFSDFFWRFKVLKFFLAFQNSLIFKVLRLPKLSDFQTFIIFARAYSLKCFKLFFNIAKNSTRLIFTIILGSSRSACYLSGFSRRRSWIYRKNWSHQWALIGIHCGYRYDRCFK